MPALALDERRALWDALDSKEERWAGHEYANRPSPAPPRDIWPLQNAMHAMIGQKPGPPQQQVLADAAGAIHEALRVKSVGDLANEVISDIFTLSVWAKEDVGPVQTVTPESEQSLLDSIVAATPRAPVHVSNEFAIEAETPRPCEDLMSFTAEKLNSDEFMLDAPPAPKPVKTEVLSSTPSWAPTSSISQESSRFDSCEDELERALRIACKATEMRRRQKI